MIKNQPIIAVADVEKSSQWYQDLLICNALHGGSEFEILADENNEIFLCLHKWEIHAHPTMSDPSVTPGNGLIIYLRVENLETIWRNAQNLNAVIEDPPHKNENSGFEQFCIRDLDGYFLMISL